MEKPHSTVALTEIRRACALVPLRPVPIARAVLPTIPLLLATHKLMIFAPPDKIVAVHLLQSVRIKTFVVRMDLTQIIISVTNVRPDL